MALIKCPECGRDNVSDSAEMCPDCGYGIKMHFDKVKQEKEKKERERKEKEAKLLREIQVKKHKEERIRSVPKPEKPKFSKGLIIYIIVAICCLIFIYLNEQIRNNEYIYVFTFLIGGFAVVPLCIYLYDFYKRLKKYNFAQSDFEEYQRQVIKEEDEVLASVYTMNDIPVRDEEIKPECPYCHSNSTNRITATDKVINIAMFGIYGQKRKYQWHCNNCKSNF